MGGQCHLRQHARQQHNNRSFSACFSRSCSFRSCTAVSPARLTRSYHSSLQPKEGDVLASSHLLHPRRQSVNGLDGRLEPVSTIFEVLTGTQPYLTAVCGKRYPHRTTSWGVRAHCEVGHACLNVIYCDVQSTEFRAEIKSWSAALYLYSWLLEEYKKLRELP